jgi:uncharacterized protein (DUF305 family)
MAKNEHGGVNKVVAGVGLAALAAAAAGAVFLYGTEAGKKRRQEIKSWSLRMKADVLDKMEKMKDWSEESYHAVVNDVAKRYESMKEIDATELAALVATLRSHWKTLKQHVEGGEKKSTKKSPRAKKNTT